MGILVIALSINPRPLSALELKLSGLIMESRVDTAGDNQNAHVIISNYHIAVTILWLNKYHSDLRIKMCGLVYVLLYIVIFILCIICLL